MSAIEKEFERLAQEISQEAADVECSPGEYREGLTTIIETLRNDLQASKELDPDA